MKKDIVQIRNPKSDRYVKIDREKGIILSHKVTKGPYKNIPIARKKRFRDVCPITYNCKYCEFFNIATKRTINETEDREKFSRYCERTKKYVTSKDDSCKHFVLYRYFHCEESGQRMKIIACLNRKICKWLDNGNVDSCPQRELLEEAYEEFKDRL